MRKTLIYVLVLGVAAAGCGDVSTEDPTTTSVAPATTTSQPAEPTTTETAEEETTTTAASATGGGPDCLMGTWTLDNETFVENFDAIFADAGMPEAEVTALDGTFIVVLDDDGTLTATRDGWGFDIDTGEGAFVLEIDGAETGTWSADDSTLTVDTDTSDLEISVSVEVDGELVEMPSEFQPDFDVPAGVASNSDYTCSAEVLTLTNEGVSSILHRS